MKKILKLIWPLFAILGLYLVYLEYTSSTRFLVAGISGQIVVAAAVAGSALSSGIKRKWSDAAILSAVWIPTFFLANPGICQLPWFSEGFNCFVMMFSYPLAFIGLVTMVIIALRND